MIFSYNGILHIYSNYYYLCMSYTCINNSSYYKYVIFIVTTIIYAWATHENTGRSHKKTVKKSNKSNTNCMILCMKRDKTNLQWWKPRLWLLHLYTYICICM